MEWNQAMSAKSSVFNHLPIHLRGEVIQIGAVRLREDWTPAEEFQIDIKPVFFRKMHFKVKKLTGIDSARLSTAPGFKEAFARFREFCGDDCTFITWGYDDKGILEQNIILHDEDWDWIAGWINLQVIYSMQTEGDSNQKSLAAAMEHFGIEQTRVAHDALGDAYNTALVGARLDMVRGLEEYNAAVTRLSTKAQRPHGETQEGPEPLEHLSFTGYVNRNAAFADEALTTIHCPHCGCSMETQRWVNQGDRRYMTIAVCPEHGSFLARVKLRQNEEERWDANRILYAADEGMVEFYHSKAAQCRKRSHRRRRKRSGEAGQSAAQN